MTSSQKSTMISSSVFVSLKNLAIVPSKRLVEMALSSGANLLLLQNLALINNKITKSLLESSSLNKNQYLDGPSFETLPSDVVSDNSLQLFSAVRTNKTDLALRLLRNGADPNYKNPNRNNLTSLHVAAMSDQMLQVELLFFNGADPSLTDEFGNTAEDIANQSENFEVAARLSEYKYFISDYLIRYLSANLPNSPDLPRFVKHSKGLHFVVNYGITESSKSFLFNLSDAAFKNLVVDMVDHLQFKSIRKIHKEFLPKSLPDNKNLSAERNAFRKCLAKFKVVGRGIFSIIKFSYFFVFEKKAQAIHFFGKAQCLCHGQCDRESPIDFMMCSHTPTNTDSKSRCLSFAICCSAAA